MNKLDSILTVIDPTVERDPVVDRVKMLAKATGASVDLFINNSNTLDQRSYIYAGIDGDFFETQRKLWESHYRKLLEHLSEELDGEGIQNSITFRENHHLADSIIDHVKKSKPDLVIKSTHHHNVLERSIITNTDWRLIRKCPAPLWLSKARPWKVEARIVTAVDPIHAKEKQVKLDHVLLDNTHFLTDVLKQKATVFHSYFPFVSAMFPPETESTEYIQRMKKEHEAKVQDLLKVHDFGTAEVKLSHGDLVPSLVKYLTDEDANLLVVGALSRNMLERAIVGNTAEKILEHCPCDMLVIKPPA